ncbi:MAG: polymorphic toxin-type HINT domain-containing protein [Clostridium sp.]|nr:polymorphic toxin-type HINT domain-containing protein [Clostridium sp.]
MKNNKGFTLVELLAVIAIMAILLVIALPNVLKMFNESKEKIFLTESKSVFKEAINQTIKDRNFSDVIYCKSMNDEVNPLGMSGREIYYYIKANVNDNTGTIIVWDNERYVKYKGDKLDPSVLDNAEKITDDIKNATCDNILEASGLIQKIDYSFTENDLLINIDDNISISFKDSVNIDALNSVKYKIDLFSKDYSDYQSDVTIYEETSTDKTNNFKITFANPIKTNFAASYTFKIYVYDENDNLIISKNINKYYCFVAGTKVLTENGYVNIENIKVGDMVYSYNFNNNELELKKVINLINSEAKETYKMDIGDQTIEMSKRHELYIIDKGWTRAYDVKVGDKMISSDDKVVTIKKIDLVTYDTPIKTYNLTVEGNNNYFVTYSKVLVHNSAA